MFAQLPPATLAAGTHSITAQYGGDANYAGASWSATALTITKSASSAGAISFNPAQPLAGQSVTVTASLFFTPQTGVPSPTGSVTFSDLFQGTTTVLGTVPLSATATGQPSGANVMFAQLPPATLAAGTHSITAQYGGDANYTGVSWSPVVLTTQ